MKESSPMPLTLWQVSLLLTFNIYYIFNVLNDVKYNKIDTLSYIPVKYIEDIASSMFKVTKEYILANI